VHVRRTADHEQRRRVRRARRLMNRHATRPTQPVRELPYIDSYTTTAFIPAPSLRYANRRGSAVAIPCTPSARRRSIVRRSFTVHAYRRLPRAATSSSSP
jgi:hypothetical protein